MTLVKKDVYRGGIDRILQGTTRRKGEGTEFRDPRL